MRKLINLIRSRRSRMEDELERELRYHLDRRVTDLLNSGLDAAEARRQAAIEFGGMAQLKEETRDTWHLRWLHDISRDLRYSLRALFTGSPAFTLTAVLSLALGIGANTAIFTLLDAVLLRMLPVYNPQELVSLNLVEMKDQAYGHWVDGNSETAFPYPAFEQIRARNQVFTDVFAFKTLGRLNTQVNGEAELARGQFVTSNYFKVLGVHIIAGRGFTADDDSAGAEPVVIISSSYWHRRFGGDPAAIGKNININDVSFTIIGVSAPEFFGLQQGSAIDLTASIRLVPRLFPNFVEPGVSLFAASDHWWVEIMGRLKPGITQEQARANLEVIYRSSILDTAARDKPAKLAPLQIVEASHGLDGLRRQFSKPLFILMTVTAVVLLIACANVANLLLVRATARRKEIAVRLSMGATRARLIRQLLIESLLLSSLGGIAGLLLAYWGSTLLVGMMRGGGNRLLLDVRPDLAVLGFTAAACVLTGLIFGLAPAFRGTRVDVMPELKQSATSVASGRESMRLTKALVVFQAALSLVLLFGTGLFVRTLIKLERQDVGFVRDNLLLFGIAPREAGYKGARYVALCREIQSRIAHLPGVISATSSLHLLLSGSSRGNSISVPGYSPAPKENMSVQVLPVGADFLSTMGMKLLQGRDLNAHDDENAPKVGLINETMARKYWRGQNPIGRHFKMGKLQLEVVGIVQDAKYTNLRRVPAPTVYHPAVQDIDSMPHMHFELRAASDAASLIPAVRKVVASIDSRLPLFDVQTQQQQIDSLLIQERLFAKLTGFFGALALLLVCVGLYGMMSYSVARRTGEIGIRMALGAQRGKILGMVVRDILILVATGLAVGIPAAFAVTRLAGNVISQLLYGLTATDLASFIGAAAAFLIVAALAAFLPARRAITVDPIRALRYE